MRLLEQLRRSLARADVRTALAVSAAFFIAVVVPAVLLYAYSSEESLEEVDRWFEFALQVAVHNVEEHGPDALVDDDVTGELPSPFVAARVVDSKGEVLSARGQWPDPELEVRARLRGEHVPRNLASVRHVRRDKWMVGERTTATGLRVQIAHPLYKFASNNAKVRNRIVIGVAVAAAVLLLVALATTALAFAPLRRATARLREVDTGSLGVRLASRGTGDPIDLHAETLNSVLARIDAGFARLRSFSSDASHELRTPLNRISNVTEVALLKGGEGDLRAALEAVHGTTEELSRMVQALLLLAEIDERRLALHPGPIELRPWIQQHVGVYAPSFEEAGIALAAKSEPIAVVGDRVLLDRIVANLLDNALSHAPAGTSVEISAARRDGGVAITVDDAGAGIADEDRERVFDRFARLSGEFGSGHGLGLALARAIAELHGGTLRSAVSRFGGARFELWLPDAGAGA